MLNGIFSHETIVRPGMELEEYVVGARMFNVSNFNIFE